jgi:glc operon protein GlcG
MKRFTLRLTGMAALLAFLLAGGLSAQLATKKALTLEAAKKIAAAAEAFAVKNNWNVVISVVDDGGHLLYLQRMDGAQLASVEISQMKARGALLYKRPTKVFEDRVASGGVNVMSLPGIAPVEGGVPITVDGQIIGAIGVSGVLSAQDAQVATAGATLAAGLK